MTSGVNGIGGSYGSYGSYGYGNNGAEHTNENETENVVVKPEAKDVDPDAVMAFLNKYVYMAPDVQTTEVPELDAETQQRIAGFMEQFEFFYGVVVQEFGEEMAPLVMDMVMDKLMGM